MEKGQICNVTIEDMSSEGQGIGRAEGLVVFVPGTVVGDTAKVQLTKVKKNYAFSKLLEIMEPSEDRIDDFDCEYFTAGCGGCAYGRLDYPAQLRLKQKQVTEKLQRLAGLESPVIRPIIGMAESDNEGNGPFRYRNKAQFPVSTGGIITRKGGIVENLGDPAVGFFRAKSHDVVDCQDCYLQSMAAMAAADALRRFMEEDHITAWDPKWEKGLMRHLIVKTGFATGEVMVVLVINGKGVPNVQKLIEMLDDAIYEVGYSLESVVLNVNQKPDMAKDGILGDENIVIAGNPVIRDQIGELTFEISPSSFYQVNPVQVERLYDVVKDYCQRPAALHEPGVAALAGDGEAEKPVILDLYCGVGTIGLYCADIARGVVGIERVKEAVIDANRNAVVNGIVNARYICGSAEDVLPKYVGVNRGTGSGGAENGNAAGGNNIMKGAESAEEMKDVKRAGDNNAAKASKVMSKMDSHGVADGDEGRRVRAAKTEIVIDEDIAEMIADAGIAILDPPRSGCRPELLKAVADAQIPQIVYVSCDPATLARDVKLLREMGYEFVEATPVDMFPWTVHVETVCLLSKIHN